MGISLFEHNDAAYKAAVKMLDKKGKAAVVHPTDTGKSFIGFKLCENNPDAVVCWLSPSEYIFKTQVENLEKAGGGINENVKFFTYSKLTIMSDEEYRKSNQITSFLTSSIAAVLRSGAKAFLNYLKCIRIRLCLVFLRQISAILTISVIWHRRFLTVISLPK